MNKRKIHFFSLGCARNRVDTEVMIGGVAPTWQVAEDVKGCAAVVINTCGFIQSAKEESIDTILQMTALKKKQPDLKVIVCGCLTQRYKSQLVRGMPEVDLFIGTDQFKDLPVLLDRLIDQPEDFQTADQKLFAKRTNYLYDATLAKKNTLTTHSAYVKVAEGCQHNCSFCIIPAIRGKLRSRPIPNIVEEVKDLVSQGVVEINLIAQDLAAYGRDKGESLLLPLLQALEDIDGLEWVRMLYVYPENISDEFLDFIASSKKLVKYLDIPVQHASDSILSKMNRCVSRQDLISILAKLRTRIPDMVIRTTVMSGFPGETQDDHKQLLDFVEEMRFDHLGCFAYSKEENTPAGRMKEQIEEDVKQERVEQVMALQQKISRKNLEKYIGTELDVIYESHEPVTTEDGDEYLVVQCRSAYQAPEVDGKTFITIKGDLKIPKGIFKVKVQAVDDYDLWAVAIDQEKPQFVAAMSPETHLHH